MQTVGSHPRFCRTERCGERSSFLFGHVRSAGEYRPRFRIRARFCCLSTSFCFAFLSTLLCRPFFLFLSCSLSSVLSPPLGRERAHLRVVGPAARSWILWQEFLCRASDHNLPRRTCRRCSDGNIKLPCSRYPWAAWFTDSRAPLCDPDKRAFYKGALLAALDK